MPRPISSGTSPRCTCCLAARPMQRANEALWLVGLGEERFRPVGTMSTGQRQRVKLASAIAHDPELVLLDEPTDGLDPMQRTEMLDLIRRIGTEFGMHIIVSSHHLEEVERICDGGRDRRRRRGRARGDARRVRRGPDGLVVEVDGRADELAAILTARGFAVTVDGGVLLLAGDDGVLRRRSRRGRRPRGRAAAARAARADARGRLPRGGRRDDGQDAQLFDLGYRGYDGAARAAGRAILTLGRVHDAARPRAGARCAPQGAARDHARDRVPAGLRLGRRSRRSSTGSRPGRA